MAESASPPPLSGREAPRGLVDELLRLSGSLGRHLQALGALAGLEIREATGVYVRVLALVIIAAVLLLFGYLFALLFLAFAAATLFGLSWIWIAAGLAALHFLGAAICLYLVKTKLRAPVFAATGAELKKDFAALSRVQP